MTSFATPAARTCPACAASDPSRGLISAHAARTIPNIPAGALSTIPSILLGVIPDEDLYDSSDELQEDTPVRVFCMGDVLALRVSAPPKRSSRRLQEAATGSRNVTTG